MRFDPAAALDLSGRVALIADGSRGLGRVMTEAFATAGADVVTASRSFKGSSLVSEDRTEYSIVLC
jgi:NAD(P)-dependent dehydrogenase (short-subunit alcohol dehydrogenase family)